MSMDLLLLKKYHNEWCRSKYGTPTISILCSATGVLCLSWMTFQEILEFLNFLYSVGMILEFAAFIKLRIKKPDLYRPYKVPLGTSGAVILCVPPTLLLVLVMCLASAKTYLVSSAVICVGVLLYPVIVHAKERKWVRFVEVQQPECETTTLIDHLNEVEGVAQAVDEAGLGLLQGQRHGSSADLAEELKLE